MSINTPGQVIETVVATGQRKSSLTSSRPMLALLSAIMAGTFIALGGLLAVIVSQGFPEAAAGNEALCRVLSGVMFPIGLILVVFMGVELFTGNNALLIPAAMRHKLTVGEVALNWTIVYIGNFIGAVGFTLLFAYATGITDSGLYSTAAVKIATTKVNLSWWEVFTRGIGANMLVCLAIWLGLSCRGGFARMFGLWLPVMAFVVLGFEHSIANMFYLPLGLLHGAGFTIAEAVWQNLIPATLGNIVGGALFVGAAMTWLHGRPSPSPGTN